MPFIKKSAGNRESRSQGDGALIFDKACQPVWNSRNKKLIGMAMKS